MKVNIFPHYEKMSKLWAEPSSFMSWENIRFLIKKAAAYSPSLDRGKQSSLIPFTLGYADTESSQEHTPEQKRPTH